MVAAPSPAEAAGFPGDQSTLPAPPSGPGSGTSREGAGASPSPAPPPEQLPPHSYDAPEDKEPELESPDQIPGSVELRADQLIYDRQLQRMVATGNVSALLAGGRLLADRLEYASVSRTLYAFGSIRFQRGSQYLQASRLRFSLIESSGEIEDVYGVLDLDGSAQDFDLEKTPSVPLPAPEPMACSPVVPPIPIWQPYPWSVTAWMGKMYTANFGDTFTFKGSYRPEYLAGVGLQRRLFNSGPLHLELDANLFSHFARSQPGGAFNQEVPNATTPSQTFGEATLGIGARLWLRPWLNVFFEEGVSLLSEPSNWEKTNRENYATFLNYLAFEVEGLISPEWSIVGRIHHRSGAFGTYSGVSEGSNGYLLGVRHRFGSASPGRLQLELPPAQGCPGAPPPGNEGPPDLAERVERVALEGEPDTGRAGNSVKPTSAIKAEGTVWSRARERERQRQQAIARIDQHISELQFEQSLVAERRVGFPKEFITPDTANTFGQARPAQLADRTTKSNQQLVQGTISRWRFQARRLKITPTALSGDRIAFTNDPFTPAQSWLDSENVVATLTPGGDTVIKAERNQLLLEDRFKIPVRRQTTIKKQEEVENRWVLSADREDRDGFYGGYDIPIKIGENGKLMLQPQFMIQRAYNNSTDSYPLPGSPPGAKTESQPITTGDLFGLQAKLLAPLAGFQVDAQLELSTFNPENFDNGTRAWGDLRRSLNLPLLGESTLRLFGAYRYRVWNGTLGEQDVYSAYGFSVEDNGALPNWGRLSSNYFWRVGMGNYQANASDSSALSDLWRSNAIGSLNLNLPLWTGKPAALSATQAYNNSATPIVPGLGINANILGTLAYYGDGRNQNTLTVSGGPTLTLGHFVKPAFDFTRLTITGGGTLRQGVSPLGFDRAVDLGTLGIGLTQQIVGPIVFDGGIGFNVDPNSSNYGDITNSYVELRWQRRSYEIGVFYSPYNGLGGFRVKLNDFNFKGTGVPFVPYQPQTGHYATDLPF